MIQWHIHSESRTAKIICQRNILLSNILPMTQTSMWSSQKLAQFFLTFTVLSISKVYSIWSICFVTRLQNNTSLFNQVLQTIICRYSYDLLLNANRYRASFCANTVHWSQFQFIVLTIPILHLWSKLCQLHSPQLGNGTSSANPYGVTQVSVESFWPLCWFFNSSLECLSRFQLCFSFLDLKSIQKRKIMILLHSLSTMKMLHIKHLNICNVQVSVTSNLNPSPEKHCWEFNLGFKIDLVFMIWNLK